ncbi:MAG: hypothetical protein MUE73_16930, partial [Planctomycetes bacterium]|nr:hypothetical protein [Planctomycetota bacterium]
MAEGADPRPRTIGDGGGPVRPRRKGLVRSARRLGPLFLGLLAAEALLHGPSLAGQRILLPTDCLADLDLPVPGDGRPPRAALLTDLVTQLEPFRAFAASEVRAGRFPLWNPFTYCGSPLLATGQAGVLSPFMAIRYLFPSPFAIAWIGLALTLFAGTGAFLFFRYGLRARLWPARFGGMVFPFAGFMLYWHGFPHAETVAWLPWLLLAADRSARRPGGGGPFGLSLGVSGTLLAGHPGTAAPVFLIVAGYGLFRAAAVHGKRLLRPLAGIAGGAVLGLALSLPMTLPVLEYLAGHADRPRTRAAGGPENPPAGLVALPLVVAPDFHGTLAPEAPWTLETVNKLESPAGGYAGLLTALAFAPLAFLVRRRRRTAAFFAAVALLGLVEPLDLPALREVFRLPPFPWLMNNRLVFGTSFGLLSLGVLGLSTLRRGGPGRFRRSGFILPVSVLAGLVAWSAAMARETPEGPRAAAERLERDRDAGRPVDPVAAGVVSGYARRYATIRLTAAGLGLLGLAWWALLALKPTAAGRAGAVLSAIALAEVLHTAFGVTPQSPAGTFYPPVPLFDRLRAEGPGRVLPVRTLLPNLPMVYGLRDVRGYDALDPAKYVELLDLVRHPGSGRERCTALFDYFPEHVTDPARMSSVLHMLDVRWIVLSGAPPTGVRPHLRGDGFFVLENPGALGRVFVPRRAEAVPDRARRLMNLKAPSFDARELALLESAVPPEIAGADARG